MEARGRRDYIFFDECDENGKRRSCPFTRVQREGGQEGAVVVGQGVGNDRTTPEEPAEERRREGHGDARCRKAAGKSGSR